MGEKPKIELGSHIRSVCVADFYRYTVTSTSLLGHIYDWQNDSICEKKGVGNDIRDIGNFSVLSLLSYWKDLGLGNTGWIHWLKNTSLNYKSCCLSSKVTINLSAFSLMRASQLRRYFHRVGWQFPFTTRLLWGRIILFFALKNGVCQFQPLLTAHFCKWCLLFNPLFMWACGAKLALLCWMG